MYRIKLKTIILLILCLGITIPTNAAVSVSDGSAFVTKAEFSADLNNLSNRMAQLENSLDAKIDSLVSSYLTRNGIWNGSRQDIITPTFTIPVRGSFNVVSGTNDYSVTGAVQQLFKANKSGMAYVNESWCIQSGLSANNWRYGGLLVAFNAGNGASDHKIFLTVYFRNISTNTLLVSWLLGSANGSPNSADETSAKRYGLYIPVPGSEVYNSSIFFVNKDDIYGYNYQCGLFISSAHVDKSSAYNFSNSPIVLRFKEVTVY